MILMSNQLMILNSFAQKKSFHNQSFRIFYDYADEKSVRSFTDSWMITSEESNVKSVEQLPVSLHETIITVM